MSTSVFRLLALLTLALVGAGRVSAQLVVNIDFNAVTGTYSGQGAYSDPGHNFWNGVSSTAGGSGFTASDGSTSTGISISVSGAGGVGFGGTPAFGGVLLSDYLYVTGSNVATFTIGGLTPGQAYEFYFYSVAGGSGATNRGAVFTLDGNSQSVTGMLAGSFIAGTNYLKFTATPGGTTLSGSFAVAPSNSEAEFNGLQIVAAVPEPATSALIGGAAALAGLLVIRRRGGRIARA